MLDSALLCPTLNSSLHNKSNVGLTTAQKVLTITNKNSTGRNRTILSIHGLKTGPDKRASSVHQKQPLEKTKFALENFFCIAARKCCRQLRKDGGPRTVWYVCSFLP